MLRRPRLKGRGLELDLLVDEDAAGQGEASPLSVNRHEPPAHLAKTHAASEELDPTQAASAIAATDQPRAALDPLDCGEKAFIRSDEKLFRRREVPRHDPLIRPRFEAEAIHLDQRPFDFAETGPMPQLSLADSLIVIRTVSTGEHKGVLAASA